MTTNYKILSTIEHPDIFTIEDQRGNKIADVRGRENAERFAMLPKIVEFFEKRHSPSALFSAWWDLKVELAEIETR